MTMFPNRFITACLGAILLTGPATAEPLQGAHLSIELNAVEPVDDACRISFLIRNGHPFDIEKAVYEAVLFDSDGRVDHLTLFDFGTLPAARPRVRQFVVPDLDCKRLGRLLFNGAETCSGPEVTEAACTKDLDLQSRTDVEIIG